VPRLAVRGQSRTDDAGERLTMAIQPVIPSAISDDWNLISRIITLLFPK
jgi:hypothetical protein